MTKGTKKGLAIAGVVGGVGALLAFLFWPRSAAASEGGGSMSVLEVQAMLRRVFTGSSIPVWFAFAVAQLESGFGANPRGDRGRSYGVFHLFWPAQRTTAQALGVTDPETWVRDLESGAVYWRDHVASVFARLVGATREDTASWERVRLRLAGAGGRDGLPDSPSDEARLARYRPVAAQWRSREGG